MNDVIGLFGDSIGEIEIETGRERRGSCMDLLVLLLRRRLG